MPAISLIYGLGNPGDRYRNTRHNLGWMSADFIVRKNGLSWEGESRDLLTARWIVDGREIILLRSLMYMNESGEALAVLNESDGERIESRRLLVICDDMSLPLGRMRIREKGGSGGHRGLESIIYSLESENFPRLRMGIGSPPQGITWTEYVLSPFLEEEIPVVEAMVKRSVEAVECIVTEGVATAMQRFNAPPKETD